MDRLQRRSSRLRVGELVHLLIEGVDLDGGWLHVRNKTGLGWRVKTGEERSVPFLPKGVAVLRSVIGQRKVSPVFVREKLVGKRPTLGGDRRERPSQSLKRQSHR